MPWKETCVVDLRSEFVVCALDPNCCMAEVCRGFGISRKTGYKWLQRFKERGILGLEDLSRRPERFPLATPSEVTTEIFKLRVDHSSWGPKKIRALLKRLHPERRPPSESTIARILERSGLVRLRRRARQQRASCGTGRICPQKPNDLWTVDYKGWWTTRDGQRCMPLTVRDQWSRFILELRATPHSSVQAVRGIFEDLFTRYGLPEAIRSDNGTPFASMQAPGRLTRLSSWWKALGIELDHIDPGKPQQNGAHERMHRDIRAELESCSSKSLKLQQKRFDQWRRVFNTERPHEALGMRRPSELYERSKRLYVAEKPDILYPDGYLVRTVHKNGCINFRKRTPFISEAIAGWPVGLEYTEDHSLRVWFMDLCLGLTDSHFHRRLRPSKEAQA